MRIVIHKGEKHLTFEYPTFSVPPQGFVGIWNDGQGGELKGTVQGIDWTSQRETHVFLADD
jgi:hypothetical protein